MRKARWMLVAVAVGLIGLHFGLLLINHPEQDACTFGAVSNGEYRSLLGKARLGRWRPFQVWGDGGITLQLNQRYRELLPSAPSASMKVAVAHAVLRALGAEFQRFDDMKSSVPDAKIQRTLHYQYLLDLNRLFYFSPLPRNMFILVALDNPLLSTSEQDRSDLLITALLPNLMDGIPRVERGSAACPIIPSI